ncbi:MAG: hypothetical protein ACR2OB_04200 [Solirubrobacteraceae bacterium]
MPLTYCPGCHTTVHRLLMAAPGMLCPSCLERGDHFSLLFAPPDTQGPPPPESQPPATSRFPRQMTARRGPVGSHGGPVGVRDRSAGG